VRPQDTVFSSTGLEALAGSRAQEKQMTRIMEIDHAEAHILRIPDPFDSLMSVTAVGKVPTTGWTGIRLSPYFYITPPADGIWDFDFIGDAPSGIVGEVVLPVSAHSVVRHPKWCKGVRIHAARNTAEARLAHAEGKLHEADSQAMVTKAGHVIINQHIASYDDSFQPTGATKFDPWPHIQMKKLHHDLTLVVEGPDEARIRDCINKALAAGLIAAIVAACATLGAALPAAISAFLKMLTACLGSGFTVRMEDRSHWEYWWT
jgi:hypothetical protein